MDTAADAAIFELLVKTAVDLLEAGLEAQRTFFQLTELLVAHCHIVKELQCNHLVATTARDVDDVEHPVGFLQEEQGILVLLFLDEYQSTFIQLK